jgi:transposase
MSYIHGVHRHEVSFFPERLDDSIAEDNPVRVIDAFVDALDRAACGFQRAVPAATGRPGYAPGALLTLYLYGYLHRRCSSRRLAQATPRNVEGMWLLQQLRPAHTTLADVRKHNRKPLRQVCRTFPLLCKKLALCGAALVAIDGSQWRAVNAQERNCTQAKLQKRIAQIDERVEASRKDLDGQANAEEAGTPGGAVVDH